MSEPRTAGEQAQDVLLEKIPVQAQWAAVASQYEQYPTGLWLVVAPDCDHPVMAGGNGLRTAHIVPDMADEARRSTAHALRAHEVDVLFVTPERFAQEKFLSFLTELAPVVIVVTSAQVCVAPDPATRAQFAPLSALRTALRDTPKIIMTDNDGDARKLTAYFALRCAPTEAPTPPPAAPQKVAIPEPTKKAPRNPGWEQAFRLFSDGTSLSQVADTLQQDEAWTIDSLIGFIVAEKRTNPFPWVTQPDYLTVAMAAGQAETTEPNILLPILADRVAPGPARIALAALHNRALGRPRP